MFKDNSQSLQYGLGIVVKITNDRDGSGITEPLI